MPVTTTFFVNPISIWMTAPAAYAPFELEAVTFATDGTVESKTNVRVVVHELPAASVARAVIV